MATNIPSLENLYGPSGFTWYHGSTMHDTARQQQEAALASTRANTRATDLTNMFNDATMQDRIASEAALAQGRQTDANAKDLAFQMDQETYPWRKDQKFVEYLNKVKQSELDMMELEAQRLAYSRNPQERAAGEELMMMHKDFVKMREQHKNTLKAQSHQHGLNMSLEKERQSGKLALKQAAAKGIQDVFAEVQKGMARDKAAAAFGAAALQAQAQGDQEGAQLYFNAARQMEQLSVTSRPDTQAGKPDAGQMGVPVVPKRPGAFDANVTAPPSAPKHSLSDVQKMYPGVPLETLKQRYKSIYGVDLK